MTANLNSQLLSDEEIRVRLVASTRQEAEDIALIVKTFWLHLPEEMPELERSKITLLWFSSTFLEVTQ